MRKLLKKQGFAPDVLVTDKFRSYGAAKAEIGLSVRHEQNSHQPFRRRERAMVRFRSMKTLQKFSSVHAQVHNHFNLERHRHCHAASGLRSLWRADSQADEENQLQRVSFPA